MPKISVSEIARLQAETDVRCRGCSHGVAVEGSEYCPSCEDWFVGGGREDWIDQDKEDGAA